jgi:hypothetical protein
VSYHVHFHPRVLEYFLRPEVVSADRREALAEACIADLTHGGESFRLDPSRRVRPGSACFWYDRIFFDRGAWQYFLFAVSDARAAMGVLIVGYVERLSPPD